MEIRQATIEDLEGVLKYSMKIAEQHNRFNPVRFSAFPNHRQLLKAYFEIELCSHKSIVSLLIDNSEIVGYALVKLDDDSLEDLALQRAWLHDIFVDEKVRGLKGGQRLF
jgi:hypothetical protein